MGASSFSSLLILLSFLSLLSNAFTSMHGFIDDPLIRQVGSSGRGGDDLLTSAEHQFSAFKKKYGKTYPTQEEDDYRFGVFISNLRLARRHQILDPTAVHGVTKFSDLTPLEFRHQYLSSGRHEIQVPNDIPSAPVLPTEDLPPTMNWTAEGAVTPVKNQSSNCDSCWAFSTIATLEGAHFLANNKLVNLSEQQLIDCSEECSPNDPQMCDRGCEGGNRILAYKYIKNAGGVKKAEDYPYIANGNGYCNLTKDKSEIVASISSYHYIKPNEDQYAAYLVKHGPISVSINIDKLYQTYESGVLCPNIGYLDNPEVTKHAVVLVGYTGNTTNDHWIIKNSYGVNFGEFGYSWVCRGKLITETNKDPKAIYVIAKNKTTSIASY
ncbi:hypothetical protein ACOSQ2_011320 [Xanthoceras sorbifolium]|uniref:Uncharacterized protein n=1 Tax=Xanthoceras sorbifolium TaxID=99658 RepID=A0ABQ8HSB7_9ROSI|nr:hypothetical protein JRO89_XS07G0030400 [Xanthoceras sorbifolium]